MDSQEVKSANEDYRVSTVHINNVPLVSLTINSVEMVCLAQLSNTLLKDYSYNEIHNRRVALSITCVQCSPLQLEVLRKAKAMPVSSRRCGMITTREAERLYNSFYHVARPPKLPPGFIFNVYHHCGWGCGGVFYNDKYNRAKCIQCNHCGTYFSPNKFIFHCHETGSTDYVHPDAANFNSWRRHIQLSNKSSSKKLEYAWEDVKALFNGGSRKRLSSSPSGEDNDHSPSKALSTTYPGSSNTTICTPLTSIPHGVRMQHPSLATMHPGFSAGLFRRDATLSPMWPPTHQLALSELIHGSRFFLPNFAAHQTLSQYQQARALNAIAAGPHATARTPSRSESVITGYGSIATVVSDGESSQDTSKQTKAKDKKIKRPWVDSTKNNEDKPNYSKDIVSKSETSLAACAATNSPEDDPAKAALLRSLFQHMDHPVLL